MGGNMKQAKVVFINNVGPQFHKVFKEHVPEGFKAVLLQGRECSENEIVDQMRDADFLLLLLATVPERALRQAKKIKLIQLFTQGYDNVPLHITEELGIPVANFIGGTAAVAEHTILLMLALLRRLLPSIAILKSGKFNTDVNRTLYHQLCGKVAGLVGLGNIGRHVAGILRGFGADVIFYDKAKINQDSLKGIKARPVNLEELLRTSDIVSLHLPLLQDTRGLIGREQFEMMKPSAIFLNTSRGELVDEGALIQALKDGEIAGAGLDVYAREPPDRDNPLLTMENVVTTPHIADAASESYFARFDESWGNITAVWQGKKPRNVVSVP